MNSGISKLLRKWVEISHGTKSYKLAKKLYKKADRFEKEKIKEEILRDLETFIPVK